MSVETIQKLRNGIFIADGLELRITNLLDGYFKKEITIESVEKSCELSNPIHSISGFGEKSLFALKSHLVHLREQQKIILERDLAKVYKELR
jgi:hypothetical protein